MAEGKQEGQLPAPLVPPDCDLRDLPAILIQRSIVTSELAMMSTGDEFKAAFTLYEACYDQIPAGSLPSDDRALAYLSRAGTAWPKVKKMALRGWTLHSDGRLYHAITAEKVLTAWIARVRQRWAAKSGGASKNGTAGFDPSPFKQQVDAAMICLARLNPGSKEVERWRKALPLTDGKIVHLRAEPAA